MAKLVKKQDERDVFKADDFNNNYAHIYSNLIMFAIDGLGSTNQQNIITNEFSTNNMTKTGFIYDGGSYTTDTGTGSCSLISSVKIINADNGIIIPSIIGSKASTSTEKISISLDNGSNYTEIDNTTMGSIITGQNTGSFIFKYELYRSDTNTSDKIEAYGVYYS